jgi:hypothetical protein
MKCVLKKEAFVSIRSRDFFAIRFQRNDYVHDYYFELVG